MRGLIFLFLTLWAAFAFGNPSDGYNLRSNWPLAHSWRDGVVADASLPGFIKYTRDRGSKWKYDAKVAGRSAALCPGLQANLWLPVTTDLAGKNLVVEAGIYPYGSKVDVFVNDKKIGSPSIKSGEWQNIRVALKDAPEEGIVKVRLHFDKAPESNGMKTATALRFLRLALADSPALPADEAGLAAALPSVAGDQIKLPQGSGLDWYVTPPKGMKLQVQSTGELEALAALDSKAPKSLGKSAQLAIDLDQAGGLSDAKRKDLNGARAMRLMLRANADSQLSGRIAGGTSQEPTIKKPKYIVFWMIDAMRADKWKSSAIPNPHKRQADTPNIDAIAKEAFVADPYMIQGNESKVSHATLFTGVYPVVHRMVSDQDLLNDKFTTIAEMLKGAGYYTKGFGANGYVSDRWNFVQGFDQFNNFVREQKGVSAEAIYKAAKGWIPKGKDKPFYLFLGTVDPHVTYRSHEGIIEKYDGKGYNGPYKKALLGEELGKIKQKGAPSEREQKRIEALYENEIDYNDGFLGKLVQLLKDEGIWDETMLIITADHGDEFWEHGSCGHGHNLNQELVRVPMIIRYPGVFPAKSSSAGFEGADLLPTLAQITGAKLPKEAQGASMLPYAYSDGVYPNAMIASQGVGQHTLQVGNSKIIYSSDSSYKIFDVAADPNEKQGITQGHTVLTLASFDPLSLFFSHSTEWKKAVYGAPNNLIGEIR